jgi:hypothetical protein
MRTTLLIAVAGAALTAALIPATSRAWDGPGLWYSPAAGAQPGGSGIIGTGGALDHNVTCANCHMKAESKIDLKLDFSPALPTVGGLPTPMPGQQYQVSVQLTGEHLGLSACEQYTSNINNFAATVEDAGGKLAGVLASDSGQSSTSCPASAPDPVNGTTLMYSDCHAVMASGAPGKTSWTFSWTAPQAGAGPLTLYYGAVDGNCDMMSMDDDVKVGSIKMGSPMASLTPAPAPGGEERRFAWAFGLLPLGLVIGLRRRPRKHTS